MPATRPGDTQFDLWPPRVVVEELDAKAVAGANTRVRAVCPVRYERERGVHQGFFAQHGRYCAEHGPGCKAVRDVTARKGDGGVS